MSLFVQHGVVAGRSERNRVLTVHLAHVHVRELAPRAHVRHGEGRFIVGEIARFSGDVHVDGSSLDLQAQSGTLTPAPAVALAGTVSEVGGSLVIVDQAGSGGWGHFGDDFEPVIVDDSSATITLDGASATASQITSGLTVIVLGTESGDEVLAASIYAFSTPPAVAAGVVEAISGTTIAVGPQFHSFQPYSMSGDDDHQSWQGGDDSFFVGPTLVDVSSATIVLNGVSGATVSELAQGDIVVAVGTTATSPLAATVVFAFNSFDLEPLLSFANQGGDSQGGGGSNDGGPQGQGSGGDD